MISKRISGAPLRALAALARTRAGAFTVQQQLLAQLAIARLADLPETWRTPLPISNRVHAGRAPRGWAALENAREGAGWAPGIREFQALYTQRESSPRIVVELALRLARDLQGQSCGPLCEVREQETLREADRATARLLAGTPLSDLDGVPFVVKEQIAVQGFSRRFGTSFLPMVPQPVDGSSIAKLRALGAIPIGMSAMTEYGMTPSGVNAKRAMPRNPHDVRRIAGGSSTGSGVAVATGLVPFAIGVDGGGSVRIPAAANGVFGIKPTWGRISRDGDPSGGSVAHLGPIAGSTHDLARVLAAMAGEDGCDPETEHTPAVADYVASTQRNMRGAVVGVCASEWADASPAAAKAGEQALRELERAGVVLRDIKMQLARFAAPIGYVTIAIEARANLRATWAAHAADMSHDLQVSFAALDAFSAMDYADAQRLRGGLRREVAGVLGEVDALALPALHSAPAAVSDREHRSGVLDPELLDGLCRFMFLGNLCGLPALVAPVGMDPAGLPLGLQLVGDAWDEGTLFGLSALMEREGIAQARRPGVSVDILG